MASLAEFERSLIAERVKAGMERAKAQGKHMGRPRLPEAKQREPGFPRWLGSRLTSCPAFGRKVRSLRGEK
jgi:hypothetical protein